MGVTTTADTIIYSLDKNFEAIDNEVLDLEKKLEKVLNKDTWGSGDFKESYIKELERGLQKVQDVRRKMRKLKRRLL